MNEHLATTTGGYLNEQSYHINGINCTMADNFPEKCFERTGQSEIKVQSGLTTYNCQTFFIKTFDVTPAVNVCCY